MSEEASETSLAPPFLLGYKIFTVQHYRMLI